MEVIGGCTVSFDNKGSVTFREGARAKAKLMAAMPDMVDALVVIRKIVLGYDSLEEVWDTIIPKTIMLAMPEEVSREVLDE